MKTLENLIIKLQDTHRKREYLLKAKNASNNQIKAIERRCKTTGEDVSEYQDVIDIIAGDFENTYKKEQQYLKQIGELARQLPYSDRYASFNRCSYDGYGQIIAELGDPTNYDSPAKFWKRMGLSVENGRADKNREKGKNTGYNPRRRSIMFRLANSIGMGKYTPGYYTEFYKNIKEREIKKNEDGGNKEYVERNKLSLLAQFQSKANRDFIEKGMVPPSVLEKRTNRKVAKKLLKDIWAWWNPDKVIPHYEKQFEKEFV